MTSPSAVDPAGQAAPCPHGLRPGTTVCLRCRQEARAVARQRRVRLAGRAGLAFMGVAVVVALLVGAWNAITSDRTSQDQASSVASEPPPVSAGSTRPVTAAPGLQPVIAEGRRDIGDSVYAVRRGAEVTVYFDTDSLRTRFDWKFEGVVRATLPLVFGPDARAALDSIPAGTLASGADLLDELPRRGIPLKLGNHTLRVWPITRDGRDGPLVVAYRASSSR